MSYKISVIGLGAGDLNQLPLGVYKMIQKKTSLYLRTKEHPVVQQFEKEGISYTSFDSIYEKHDQFKDVYEEIVKELMKLVEIGDVVYGVPGHPMVAEKTVQLLLERIPDRINVIGGQSFLDSLFQAVKIDPIEGFQLLDGTLIHSEQVQLEQHVIIGQVYDSFVASNVKLSLMEKLPDDYVVYIVTAAGSSTESVVKVPLYELDRQVQLNNLTSIYVPPVKEEQILYKTFGKLKSVIAELRGPNGCPWDKEQTHESLTKYLIEEAYELIDAIEQDDIDHIMEELGDVLLQIMLHAQIGEDDGFFTIDDVIEGLTEKMIRRHPHVFGDVSVQGAEEVIQNWQAIKLEEKSKTLETSILSGVGKSMPNLFRAFELQKRAAKVGFDWDSIEPAWNKVKEEMEEFSLEVKRAKKMTKEQLQEFGDILFALVNIARYYGINPEEALYTTNEKFIRRFQYIEEQVENSGKVFSEYTLEELDQYWEEAKKQGL